MVNSWGKKIRTVRKRKVRWNPSASGDVEGYRLYWAAGEGVDYTSDFAELGNVTEIVLPDDVPAFPRVSGGLALGVTAVNGAGNESDMMTFSFPVPSTAQAVPTDLTGLPAWEALGKRIRSLITSPVFLATAFIASLILLLPNSTSRHFPPIFEEIYPTAIELSKETGDSDFPVYESLHGSGAGDEDAYSESVQMINQNDYVRGLEEMNVSGPDDKMARPKIALIVDDLGYDPKIAISFLKLDLSLSLSVLPSAPFTDLIVREVNKTERELMVHLPMEPKGYPSVDPGPGALLIRMTEPEIQRILDQDLKQISGARGVNNHMGSLFTENRGKMELILRELKRRNLFYVDSWTTSGTVGFKVAKEVGVPAGKRNVFLDNELSAKSIERQMERLFNVARRSGSAIGILHPHEETLEVLKAYQSRMKTEFDVVSVSDLVG
jgi:polysaccharide deacetylase 2 family uncharacterized protein YibQ